MSFERGLVNKYYFSIPPKRYQYIGQKDHKFQIKIQVIVCRKLLRFIVQKNRYQPHVHGALRAAIELVTLKLTSKKLIKKETKKETSIIKILCVLFA